MTDYLAPLFAQPEAQPDEEPHSPWNLGKQTAPALALSGIEEESSQRSVEDSSILSTFDPTIVETFLPYPSRSAPQHSIAVEEPQKTVPLGTQLTKARQEGQVLALWARQAQSDGMHSPQGHRDTEGWELPNRPPSGTPALLSGESWRTSGTPFSSHPPRAGARSTSVQHNQHTANLLWDGLPSQSGDVGFDSRGIWSQHTGLSPEQVDQAFQRDSRRYDRGFALY